MGWSVNVSVKGIGTEIGSCSGNENEIDAQGST